MGTRKLWFYLALIPALPLLAQEADFGLTLPITFSAGGMYSHRWQLATPTAGPLEAGAHAMFYPSLKLGEHWYAYGAIDVNSSPYYGFQANSATNRVKVFITQGFIAYTRSSGNQTFTVQAGQVASAFGAFPLRYKDAQNPLLDAPLSYGSPSYGTFPVTLYGLQAPKWTLRSGAWTRGSSSPTALRRTRRTCCRAISIRIGLRVAAIRSGKGYGWEHRCITAPICKPGDFYYPRRTRATGP